MITFSKSSAKKKKKKVWTEAGFPSFQGFSAGFCRSTRKNRKKKKKKKLPGNGFPKSSYLLKAFNFIFMISNYEKGKVNYDLHENINYIKADT